MFRKMDPLNAKVVKKLLWQIRLHLQGPLTGFCTHYWLQKQSLATLLANGTNHYIE
jgi:hypothetical protein